MLEVNEINIRLYAAMLGHVREWCVNNSMCEVRVPAIQIGAARRATDFSFDFQGIQSRLVGGNMLMMNALAMRLGRCYSITRRFRKEEKYDFRHLAEFDLLEVCVKDGSLAHDMEMCNSLVASVASRLLAGDYKQQVAPQIAEYITRPFRTIPFAELHPNGLTEHSDHASNWEMSVAESGPVFVTHYPQRLSSWSANLIATGHTESFNLLLPGIGETVEGARRVHSAMVYAKRLKKAGVERQLQWYLDMIGTDTVPTVGFGLGLERLAMWLFDWKDIRDAQTWYRDSGFSESAP